MLASTLLATTSWFLAAIFAVALRHKIAEHDRFAAALGAYRLLPAAMVRIAAKLLIALEAGTLLLLVLVMPYGLVCAAALLLLYFAAMAINVARGRAFIDCGCGDEPTPLSSGALLRNLILAALALGAYAGQSAVGGFAAMIGTLTAGQVLVALALMLVTGLLYAAAEQLLRNQATHRRLWLGAS